jgi:serine protease Do
MTTHLTASLCGWLVLLPLSVAMANPTPESSDPSSAQHPDFTLLHATQKTFRNVADTLRPSLVRIETVGGSQPPEQSLPVDDSEVAPKKRKRSQMPFRDSPGLSGFEVADGPTTGIVYSDDGYIITSSFNFIREPLLITASLYDGRRLIAKLIARDQVRKIALLKVEATNLHVPQWLNANQLDVGQWSIALGLGFGGDDPSVNVGIISALSRMHGNAVQTDAKLSPANYGGPLCDIHGRVIGICVPMAQRPGELAGIELYDSGVGFAVPKHRIEEIVAVLKTGASFYRGWLGISVDRRHRDSLVIANVADPSPMQAAGVRPGDKILTANGKDIRHFGELVQTLYMLPAGTPVELLMETDDSGYQIEVKLARSADLGPLPDLEEPFDPSQPLPPPKNE